MLTYLHAVIDILHKLLPFRESSYWLTKVELLQTLGCLDFTSLALLDSQLPEVVLNAVIFQLLGDVDHRYTHSHRLPVDLATYYMCTMPLIY